MPETVNVVDYLTDALSESTGIPFVRDAWENKAPDNYGVVELGDTLDQQWADGELIDEVYRVQIYLYYSGSDDSWATRVIEVLKDLKEYGILMGTISTGRRFLIDVGKVQWTWTVRLYGPIIVEGEPDG